MKKQLLVLASAFFLVLPLTAQNKAAPQPFTDAKEVDLTLLLAPPPAADSAVTKAELDALVDVQKSRTKERSDLAIADDQESIWRFADVVADTKFTKENLPLFTAFFDRVVATEPAVVDPAKDLWKRPRPYMTDTRINPLLKKKTSGAYPSGHTTIGTVMGMVLSNMIPEKRAVIMARAWDFGQSRIVAGMHYASDIEAGHLAGAAITAVLETHADFKAAFEAAKSELRSVLGLK